MTIATLFELGDIVSHVTDDAARGVIVGIVTRQNDYAYQVQWGVKEGLTHFGFELRHIPEDARTIGLCHQAIVGAEGGLSDTRKPSP